MNELNAYDEWEDLIQQMFKSFILHAICDETGEYWFKEFHSIGSEIDTSLRLTFICAKKGDYIYYLKDICSPDGFKIVSEWIRISDQQVKRLAANKVTYFEELFIAKIH